MSFEDDLKLTLSFEGVYSDDPDDRGGETFMGISRRFHPDWEGWDEIDSLKDSGIHLGNSIVEDEMLMSLVNALYYDRFWTPSRVDELDKRIQGIK